MAEQEKDEYNNCIYLFRRAYRNFDVVDAGRLLQFDDKKCCQTLFRLYPDP